MLVRGGHALQMLHSAGAFRREELHELAAVLERLLYFARRHYSGSERQSGLRRGVDYPYIATGAKKSETLTDLESVKLLGRQLLGEANCRKLSLDASVPEPFRAFLINASGENPYEEFSRWDRVLKASYGKRRFVTMNIEDVYRKKGV